MLLGKHGVAPEIDEVPVYDPNALVVLPEAVVMSADSVAYKMSILQSIEGRMSQMNVKVQNLKEMLDELLDNEEIEEDVAEKIADIFGLSIAKTVDVSVTVEFNLTITLPRSEDLDDVVNNLSFSVETGYRDDADIESEDYSVVDWTESKVW